MLVDRTIHPASAGALAMTPAARPDASAGPRARLAVTAIGGLGAVLVVIGAVAPWLSFFAGLQPIRGTDGTWGVVLAVLGLSVAAIAAVHQRSGHWATRWLLGATGFVVLAIAGSLGVALLAEFRALAADPLLVARIEPGLGVALLGGALVAATSFVPIATADPTTPTRRSPSSRSALAGLVLVAGLVHLLLTQEHLLDSAPLGVGFLVVGVVQTVVAALLLLSPTRGPVAVALVVSVGSALALLAAGTVGLPLIGHGAGTGPLGPVEPFDDLAGPTLLAEVGAVALSTRLLRPS